MIENIFSFKRDVLPTKDNKLIGHRHFPFDFAQRLSNKRLMDAAISEVNEQQQFYIVRADGPRGFCGNGHSERVTNHTVIEWGLQHV